ncbi:lanthionine synthetase C family protein [Thalassomonas actiniarum]|uniref:Lanthionine synthetase C family protein n=1 Tax=Thalassomonas actiniarum TaxID=485447 RepID=A0AAF0C3J7_9GAMM|nr:lanthionine synthetase C family protein [Thalassomonas actiniarum]WDE01272.1 lanthionine synthetase C family protein [Thalassomonas actiniarum]
MSPALSSAIENRPLIEQILKQLGDTVATLPSNPGFCGLLSGLSGNLLFLYKLSVFDARLVNEEVFDDKLEFLQQQLAAHIHYNDLSSGLSGQGWLLEYLNQAQGDDYDPEMCEEIDSLLQESLSQTPWPGEIEMVLGLGGVAVYAARRLLKSPSADLFETLVSHFEQAAVQVTEHTLTWSQPADSVYRFNKEEKETPEFNLGLAHGVPGIIAALLPALKIPALHQRSKSLLLQSCDWLMAQELDKHKLGSCFGSSCNEQHISRLGWCYGDLTIALTLARVGQALELPSYLEKAKEISLHAAGRDQDNGMVNDAGLCHGSAGIALVFQLLHQHLGEEKLLHTANKWLDITLDDYREKGLKGFYMFSGVTKEHEEDTGLLMGYTGIGLCLLSALTGDTDWVDSLLMA